MSKDIGEYLDNSASKQTKKSTKPAMNLVNQTMREVSRLSNKRYEDLENIPVEILPKWLAKFFMVVKQEDGTPCNAASLDVYYHGIYAIFYNLTLYNKYAFQVLLGL